MGACGSKRNQVDTEEAERQAEIDRQLAEGMTEMILKFSCCFSFVYASLQLQEIWFSSGLSVIHDFVCFDDHL